MLEGVRDLWEQTDQSLNFLTLDESATSTVIRAPLDLDKLVVKSGASSISLLAKCPRN